MRFGYDQGVFGGLITNPDFLEVVNHPSEALLGFIGAREPNLPYWKIWYMLTPLCHSLKLQSRMSGRLPSQLLRRRKYWSSTHTMASHVLDQCWCCSSSCGFWCMSMSSWASLHVHKADSHIQTPQMIVGRIVTGFGKWIIQQHCSTSCVCWLTLLQVSESIPLLFLCSKC